MLVPPWGGLVAAGLTSPLSQEIGSWLFKLEPVDVRISAPFSPVSVQGKKA